MKLLNLGAGSVMPGTPWINVDCLRSIHAEGTPERFQIDARCNYVECDIFKSPLPFEDMSISGCLLSHIIEHADAQEGLRLLQECYRVLVPGGVVLVSVPDASYFRKVYPEDRNENWEELFGQADPNNPIPTFFEAALWFNEHKAILSEDALWAYFTRAGFTAWDDATYRLIQNGFMRLGYENACETARVMIPELNRNKFSLTMLGVK